MVKTAIQLYTLSDFDVSEPTKVQIAAETDVDGVEIVYSGLPSNATLQALSETGLEVAALTIGIEDLGETVDELVTTCDLLDTETVILGHLDESHFESVHTTRETAKLLNSYGSRFRDHGLRFLYHTHRHEFASIGDRTHFDILVEETNSTVEFELDLGWIGIADVDPCSVIRDVGHRTASVHLKDMDFEMEQFVNLGEGDLDVKRTARTAIDEGIEWLVYEHEDPRDPVESVVTGASKLKKFKQIPPSR
ncbi:sugar phosphate isomerase/epimerase family protein [Natronosalvus rutilus]|uniref:Sugar phosphate isomerase/epimerase n=1 Tax=Natronosalvus rutilus TaxID=2953753 RepID=A0A9E7N806_9EURY|nr:sugar phosphate isomerase/epimerase [Natronosalvus rutilus]UTF52234.1 sugar phosphate isomerase/epimerase [Natronosalvus rutilus]